MKISIEGKSGHYIADCLDIPGSPRTGTGKSREMALVHLFTVLIEDKQIDKINLKEGITINKKRWSVPVDYLNGIKKKCQRNT